MVDSGGLVKAKSSSRESIEHSASRERPRLEDVGQAFLPADPGRQECLPHKKTPVADAPGSPGDGLTFLQGFPNVRALGTRGPAVRQRPAREGDGQAPSREEPTDREGSQPMVKAQAGVPLCDLQAQYREL